MSVNSFRIATVAPPPHAGMIRGMPARNSVLGFVFVADAAKNWPWDSTILDSPPRCVDTELASDHRPVQAILEIP